MAAFRSAGHERVNAFEVSGVYLFRHYFEDDGVFDRLKRYYNGRRYRFEVPADDFETVRTFLADRGYGLVVVDPVGEFVVVVEKYTSHPEDVREASVIRRSVDGHTCFLLTDRDAVERAVAEGAVPLADAPVDDPF